MQIENGEIWEGSRLVGTATKELKYGYHPAIKVTVGKNIEWFEQDEPELLAKIADYARENL